jgi:hypothetical protein
LRNVGAQRLDRALDQVLAGLGEDRDPHVGRDLVGLDELADEVEVGLAGRREADLDLLVAHGHQQVEHGALAGRRHRVDQRLVAVAEVGREPPRRALDGLIRPGAVGEVDRLEWRVPMARHAAWLLDNRGYRRICTIARHYYLASFAVSLLGA